MREFPSSFSTPHLPHPRCLFSLGLILTLFLILNLYISSSAASSLASCHFLSSTYIFFCLTFLTSQLFLCFLDIDAFFLPIICFYCGFPCSFCLFLCTFLSLLFIPLFCQYNLIPICISVQFMLLISACFLIPYDSISSLLLVSSSSASPL